MRSSVRSNVVRSLCPHPVFSVYTTVYTILVYTLIFLSPTLSPSCLSPSFCCGLVLCGVFFLSTTILLLALALLAKKYRHLLREVLREMVLRETKRGFCCVVPCVVMFCGVVFSVTYLVTCLAVALLWSKIDSLHSTRVRVSIRFWTVPRLFILRNLL